ncbi:hypothetical protein cand_028840 [Cryptosporidium andersoni]|uniref:Uncharacterized protein n=1 Tax=Cryptosporidium andersoni TaxID=117008 RepID=A0A1J4MP79_9CRYT|nr:hypothetical protein cand_028840 [Cryptosporidium andersoni]
MDNYSWYIAKFEDISDEEKSIAWKYIPKSDRKRTEEETYYDYFNISETKILNKIYRYFSILDHNNKGYIPLKIVEDLIEDIIKNPFRYILKVDSRSINNIAIFKNATKRVKSLMETYKSNFNNLNLYGELKTSQTDNTSDIMITIKEFTYFIYPFFEDWSNFDSEKLDKLTKNECTNNEQFIHYHTLNESNIYMRNYLGAKLHLNNDMNIFPVSNSIRSFLEPGLKEYLVTSSKPLRNSDTFIKNPNINPISFWRPCISSRIASIQNSSLKLDYK